MARRGRRQVLQLDDVSSSHSPIRHRAFTPAPSEEVQLKSSSKQLLSLVSYASDDSSDEDSESSDHKTEDPHPPHISNNSSKSSARENQTGSDKGQPMFEIPLPEETSPTKDSESLRGPESHRSGAVEPGKESVPEFEPPQPVTVESMFNIPLPEKCGFPAEPSVGVGMESELANFFAEIQQIESTSAEVAAPPPPGSKEEAGGLTTTPTDLPYTDAHSLTMAADSSHSPDHSAADFGFIPRPDASVPHPEESKPAPFTEEKPKSSSSDAYRSMFVKGASEFVKKEKEEEKKENQVEVEEELPEEPTSEWQMVQDEATGYYYYWNIATNTVTWEIPPGYTQFLLQFKEYQERLAAIPEDKLHMMKERKIQKNKESSARETSPSPSSSSSFKPKKEKHKKEKDKHRKEKSEPVFIGPQLPPVEPVVMIGPQLPSVDPVAMIGPQLPSVEPVVMIGPQLPSVDPVVMIGPQLPSVEPVVMIGPQLPSVEPVVMIGPQLPSVEPVAMIGPQLPSVEPVVMIGPQLPSVETVVMIGPQLPSVEPVVMIGPQLPSVEPVVMIGPQLPSVEPVVMIGPQLPSRSPDIGNMEVQATADQSFAEITREVRSSESPRPSSDDGKEGCSESVESAVDSTSFTLPQDVEAIFDEALLTISESHADSKIADSEKGDIKKANLKKDSKRVDSKKADTSIDMFQPDEPEVGTLGLVVTSSSVIEASPEHPSMDVTTSVDSLKSVSADSSKPSSPMPSESDSATTTAAASTGASTSMVSSSSVVSSILPLNIEGMDARGDSEEGVVTNSGVNEGVLVEEEREEEDDLDMDFDDIDDLDRALEKALEKKLEKKKAELEMLQNGYEEDIVTSDGHPSTVPTHSDTSEQTTDFVPSEADSAVSSSVRSMELHSPKAASSSKAASSAPIEDRSAADSSEAMSDSARPKRSAAESSTKEEDSKQQEPLVKKARLVAYDMAETDEESMDAFEEVSTTPSHSVKSSGDLNSCTEALPAPPPEPADSVAEIEEMANTACAKLAFLEVTVDSLSPLQTTLIALQTRIMDWQQGGLNGEYFHQRLREVSDLLTHYESRAVPPGWTCQWDSHFRRYFYINVSTSQTQWEYPDVAPAIVDEASKERHSSRRGKILKKKKSSSKTIIGPEPPPPSHMMKHCNSSLVDEAEGEVVTDPHVDGMTSTQDGSAATADYQDGIEEDLDGVLMNGSSMAVSAEQERWKAGSEDKDSQPSTSTTDMFISGPETTHNCEGSSVSSISTSTLQALFPGEPLPPGTELLLGLPPPPPPPLPPAEETATTSTTSEDVYVCADYDDSSDSGSDKTDHYSKRKVEVVADSLPYLDPDIDGEEMVEEEEQEEVLREEEDDGESGLVTMPLVVEDPAVISKPPQLRFPAAAVSSAPVAYVSSSSSSATYSTGGESFVTVSSMTVLSAAPLLNSVRGQPLPDSVSSGPVISPKHAEERQRSPVPSHEPSISSSSADHTKRDKMEKHKKKKKEKLGSHTMSLKKKGVSTMVQNWQKVQKEVEKEERANQQRQLAIRQQLDEWKKGNS